MKNGDRKRTTTTRSSSARNTVKNYKARKATARARRNAPSYNRSGSSGGGVAAVVASTKFKIIAISVAAILLLGIILGIVFGVRSCSGNKLDRGYAPIKDKVETFEDEPLAPYNMSYKSKTKVGFSAKKIGTVTRNIPKSTTDEGLKTGYPTYGYTLSSVLGGDDEKTAMRNALIDESNYLNAQSGSYDRMDKDGFLYLGDEPALDSKGHHRRLYKHTAAVGMYLGDVSDDEQASIKEITMRPRGYNGYGVTGLYAPAGETVKISISEADMEATGGLTIHIGQALYNGQANNIWAAKNAMSRMPVILNTMNVNKATATLENGVYTAYVGSYLGGPIYIRNVGATFTATISGGVPYSHFILGYTTQEEFEENAKSSAPYFDLEVWDLGVLHSGPKHYAQSFSFDDIYKAAVLWDKVASVTTTGSSQGIVFIYDPFVAAGAAVAFPGRRSVNCPAGWMASSLDYNSIVTSGAWGNFHEYHHNFQGYGVGAGGEVTNNGMTLVSYALFTKISESRGLDNFGAGGMGGWNRYTSATWALEEALKITQHSGSPSNGNQGLALYATLLHNFGPDAYIQAKVRQQSQKYGENYLGYLKAWQDITHNDMSYYFNNILGAGISSNDLAAVKNPEYPMFVPAACVYQTGRSYVFDGQKRNITTMRPYLIEHGKPFTLDLRPYTHNNGQYVNGSIIIPDGFTYTIKNDPIPTHGTLTRTAENIYTYVPDKNNASSGDITVTLSIKKTDGSFTVGDVDITINLEQSHELNKTMLERTTYTYADESCYTDAVEAFNAGYVGYADKTEGNNANRTQNCNTDIWYTNQTGDEIPLNSVVEIKGKIYVDETAKYRIAIRGRWNVALFISINSESNYSLACSYTQNADSFAFPLTDGTYKDLELKSGDWVHFKAVMISRLKNGKVSFLGVGWGKFTPEQGVIDEEGNLVGYTPEKVSVGYASAYRSDYEFSKTDFETDYFYTRKYNYDYKDNELVNENQTLVEAKNYTAYSANHPIENLTDGNKNTWIHSRQNAVTQANPLILTLDMGEEKLVNRMIIYSQNGRSDPQYAKSFTLEGSLDNENWFEVYKTENADRLYPSNSGDATVVANFEQRSMRYYRLTVTASVRGFVLIAEIEMWNIFEILGNGNNHCSPDNEMFEYAGDWSGLQTQSSFGHVYVGKEGTTLSFDFYGTQLGILTSAQFNKNFEVEIDGRKMPSIDVKEDNSAFAVAYLSMALTLGNHSVVIRCLGDVGIDSVITF